MEARTDFKRFTNGCLKLQNMKCTTQGPVTRRSGTEFIADLTNVWVGTTEEKHIPELDAPIRTIPFVFNEIQSYVMIFYTGAANKQYVMFANNGALLNSTDGIPYSTANFTGLASYQFVYPNIKNIPRYYIITEPNGDQTYVNGTVIETFPDDDTVDADITSGTYPNGVIGCYPSNILFSAPVVLDLSDYSDFDVENFDYAQSADQMYIASSNNEPFIINRLAHTLWTEELTGITYSTNGGADNLPHWADTFGWPETVTFHQQRLIFGGTTFYRQSVWCSESGDFNNFDITAGSSSATVTDALAADPLLFVLDADTQNKIRWMQSGKALLIGTLGNEWTVTGATFAAITSENLLAQRQTNLGSERIKPIMVGITTLFIERFGRTINEFVYDFNTDSYKTSDMSILSKHVTDFSPIKYWDYQQTPDSIIWSVREDGVLLGTTYQRQHEVIGWHVHNTDGEFKTVTCIPGQNREDEVWAVVARTVDSEERLYLELFAQEYLGDEASDGHFLDSHVHTAVTELPNNYGDFPSSPSLGTFDSMRQDLPDISVGVSDITLTMEIIELAVPPGYESYTPSFLLQLYGTVSGIGSIKIFEAEISSGPGSTIIIEPNLGSYTSVYVRLVPKVLTGTVYPSAWVALASILYDGIEQVTNFDFSDQTSWTLYQRASIVNDSDIPVLKDLAHLENKEVAIVLAGVIQDSETVIGGLVYLPNADVDDEALVGLNYTSEVWPTIKDLEQQDGTSAGRVQRITNLDFDIYETGSFWSGRWSKELGEQEEYIDLETDNDDPLEQIPLYTGIKHYEFPEGYDRDATYFIRQKQPLPLTIRAVVDTIEVYK